jgi:integrase
MWPSPGSSPVEPRTNGSRAIRTYTVRRRLADGTIREYQYERGGRQASPDAESLGALLAAYRRGPEWASLKPITQRQYRTYQAVLEEPELMACRVADLTRRRVLMLRDQIAEERGPGAANVFKLVVSALLTWAVDREWIDHNPIARVKAIPGGHLRAWTEPEYAWAMKALPEHLRRPVVLARWTGQRRGDLVSLRWSAYDGTSIRLRQQKGRDNPELVIPVSGPLRAELEAWKRGRTSTLILTSEKGRPWIGTHLSHLLGREMARIDPGLAGLNIHGLRKLAAASLAEAGCSVHQIGAITGHRTLAMLSLYTRSVDQERMAAEAINLQEAAAKRAAKGPVKRHIRR